MFFYCFTQIRISPRTNAEASIHHKASQNLTQVPAEIRKCEKAMQMLKPGIEEWRLLQWIQ